MDFIKVLKKLGLQFTNPKEKGVNKMRKYILTLIVLVAAVVCFTVTAQAGTDKTVSVTASASITGTTSLTADATAFTYGTTNVDALPTAPASKRVVLTYASNYNPWKIDIYTNNTQIPTKTANPLNGSYSKGGLVTGSAAPYTTVPFKWITKHPSSAAPDPATINFVTSYNFVKDMRDEDDPATAGGDESWATSFAQGYANIAWGAGSTGVCVDPTNTTPGNNQYKGDAISGTVAVYVAALFKTGGVSPNVAASAGTYGTTIYFDLYHP